MYPGEFPDENNQLHVVFDSIREEYEEEQERKHLEDIANVVESYMTDQPPPQQIVNRQTNKERDAFEAGWNAYKRFHLGYTREKMEVMRPVEDVIEPIVREKTIIQTPSPKQAIMGTEAWVGIVIGVFVVMFLAGILAAKGTGDSKKSHETKGMEDIMTELVDRLRPVQGEQSRPQLTRAEPLLLTKH